VQLPRRLHHFRIGCQLNVLQYGNHWRFLVGRQTMPTLFAHTCRSSWEHVADGLQSVRQAPSLRLAPRSAPVHWPPRSCSGWHRRATDVLPIIDKSNFLFVNAECFAGSFSEEGAESCTTCPPHSSSEKGASTCVCQAGYIAVGSGQSMTCSRTCPTNTLCCTSNP